MKKILIIFSTTDGHTQKICSRLQSLLENQHDQVTVLSIDLAYTVDLHIFDKIVIGASIRYGKHSPKVYEFIKNNALMLDTKPNAFFSVNVVARKPEKSSPSSNPYVRKFLKQITWQPKKVAVFAGKLDYQRYTFWDRQIIRFIMCITKGPTDPMTNVEFTDWRQVENFALIINEMA